MIKLTDSLPLP